MANLPLSVDAFIDLVHNICNDLSKKDGATLVVKPQSVRIENISVTGMEGTLWLQLYSQRCDIGMNGTPESNSRILGMQTMFGRSFDGYKQTKPQPHQPFWRCTTTAELTGAIHFYAGCLVQPTEYDLYPNEVDSTEQLVEGATTTVLVNKFERNSEARRQCIEHHGISCKACGLDFEKVYGAIGAGFIHVHHLVPVSQIGREYVVNPIADLVPLCPNCHAMVHRFAKQNPGMEREAIDQLKQVIAATN